MLMAAHTPIDNTVTHTPPLLYPTVHYTRGKNGLLKALLYRQKICPQCGNVLVNRTNKSNNNEFLGCSGYPNCKYTSKLTDFIPLNNCFNDEE